MQTQIRTAGHPLAPHPVAHSLAGGALVACLLLVTLPVAGSAAGNDSQLEWQTLTTEHFFVHFHEGTEQSARRVASIAEEVYPAITGLYDFEPPNRTHFIIRDTDDYANGATYYYDDKIEIWATALEFQLRGTHNWLRDVITHEYTHMVQLQASARLPHAMPAIYLQGFGYEQERRDDVLIGYPNTIVSYPLSGTMSSAWFAEGVAQYQTAAIYNDWWDTHRDMLLRAATLEGKLLTYEQMGDLDKNGLEAELVYNHGNSLVRWIAATHGEESVGRIARELRRFWAIDEEGAFESVTGHSAHELYDAWKTDLERGYGELAASIRPEAILGEAVSDGGYLNLYPRFRPGTDELFWVTNAGNDFGATRLVRRTIDTDPTGDPTDGEGDAADAREREVEIETLESGVSTPPSWSADGRQVFYGKRTDDNPHGYRVYDIYRLDLDSEEEERLTHGLRARDPAPSPDGAHIVAVVNADGTNELVLLDSEGTLVRALTTDSAHGTQYYQPLWSADGREIVFTLFDGVSRDVALMEVESGAVRRLVQTPADDRDPCFVPGERAILFVSDRSGIFNIYRLDLDTGAITQVTHVYGGAFYPAVGADGRLAFSAYTASGYEARTLPRDAWGRRPVDPAAPVPPRGDYRLASAASTDPGVLALGRDRFFTGAATPYQEAFSVWQFLPRLIIDDGRPRLGMYVNSREVLDRHSLFGGGSVGRRHGGFEFESFVLYENRMLPVTILADAFKVRRRSRDLVDAKITGGTIHAGERRPVDFELRYDVAEIDLGARYEWGPAYSLSYWKNLSLFFLFQDYHVNLFATDDEDGTFYGKTGWDYYIGRSLNLSYDYRSVARAVDASINPRGGREFSLRAAHHWASLNPSGEQDTDTFDPIFQDNEFNEFELDWREYVALPWGRHTLELRGHGGMIDDLQVDDFFHFPVGSQPGLRGYTYYSRQARKLALGAITYRFPILGRIDRRFLTLNLHRLYGGVFFEAGNAWNDEGFAGLSGDRLLKDAGFELRLESTSFYHFPAAFYVEGAYGLDEVRDPDGELTGGESWRWYTGLLFGY